MRLNVRRQSIERYGDDAEQISDQQAPFSKGDIRVLFIEDRPEEAELAVYHLRKGGITCVHRRVETEHALREALDSFYPDIILSDFKLPQFDGQSALLLARATAPNVPFIFVSGTIGEERAIEALLHGAADYVLKDNLRRLAPAVTRALERAAISLERQRQEEQIARLTRVLRMLSGINSLIVRIRGRTELLDEACRLAVTVGGYSAAFVMLRQPDADSVEPIAWCGIDAEATHMLRASVAQAANSNSGPIAHVLKTGAAFVCNTPADPLATATINTLMLEGGFSSTVALPLSVDKTVIAVFMMTSPEADAVSEEELKMLREVSANLSFALQYLHKDSAVRHLSHFDSHTGLAKRGLFCERLARRLSAAAAGALGVGVFDLEQMSAINDSFGRHTGDLLLQHLADRLRRRFHDSDLVSQLAGGTFAFALNAGSADELASVLSGQLDALLELPFEIEGRKIPVTARSGLAMFPTDGADASVLLQNAESALRAAKTRGERHHHYSAEQHSAVMARLTLEHKLRNALQANQFELHYQPKVCTKTLRVEGVEALIRWREPDMGLVSPAAFLPALESMGLMIDVGDWVIRQAAADCRRWREQGLPAVRVAVNISPLQLRSVDFSSRFLQLAGAGQCGVDIEIVEGSLLEDSAVEVRKLEELREAGIRVAIDDFGTGYSSLSRLSELPVDTLKIDRSFVRRLPLDESGKTLVKTIIGLARAFNMNTVAEGVETMEQLTVLQQMECDQLQGFLISKPVPQDKLAALLRSGRGHAALPTA
jgi:diguanylate cyclase (GGDEF)-like protein